MDEVLRDGGKGLDVGEVDGCVWFSGDGEGRRVVGIIARVVDGEMACLGPR